MFETAIIGLWVPVVVFAHVFSAFWFLKTFLVYQGPIRIFRRRRPSRVSLPKLRVSEAGGDDEKTVDEVLDSCGQQQRPVVIGSGLSKICECTTERCGGVQELSRTLSAVQYIEDTTC